MSTIIKHPITPLIFIELRKFLLNSDILSRRKRSKRSEEKKGLARVGRQPVGIAPAGVEHYFSHKRPAMSISLFLNSKRLSASNFSLSMTDTSRPGRFPRFRMEVEFLRYGFQAEPALTLAWEYPSPQVAAAGFPAISAIGAAVDGLFYHGDCEFPFRLLDLPDNFFPLSCGPFRPTGSDSS